MQIVNTVAVLSIFPRALRSSSSGWQLYNLQSRQKRSRSKKNQTSCKKYGKKVFVKHLAKHLATQLDNISQKSLNFCTYSSLTERNIFCKRFYFTLKCMIFHGFGSGKITWIPPNIYEIRGINTNLQLKVTFTYLQYTVSRQTLQTFFILK